MIIETPNLRLRVPKIEDAALILSLFNQPDCLKYIGDKNLKNINDAESYISDKFIKMYAELGFCLFVIELKKTNEALGLCGLIKRPQLDDVDIGFAILTKYQGFGWVTEAATAVKNYAFNTLPLKRLVAITAMQNKGSCRVLEKIGFKFEKTIHLEAESIEIKLYTLNA